MSEEKDKAAREWYGALRVGTEKADYDSIFIPIAAEPEKAFCAGWDAGRQSLARELLEWIDNECGLSTYESAWDLLREIRKKLEGENE